LEFPRLEHLQRPSATVPIPVLQSRPCWRVPPDPHRGSGHFHFRGHDSRALGHLARPFHFYRSPRSQPRCDCSAVAPRLPGGQSLFSFSDCPDRRLHCDRGLIRRVRFRFPYVVAELPHLEYAGLARSRANRRLRLGRICGCGKSDPLFYAAGHVYAALFAERRRTRHSATDSRRPGPFHSLHSIHARALDRMDHGGLPGHLPDLLSGLVALYWYRHGVACSSFLRFLFASFVVPIWGVLGCVELDPCSGEDYSARANHPSCGPSTRFASIFCGITCVLHLLLIGDFIRAIYFHCLAFPLLGPNIFTFTLFAIHIDKQRVIWRLSMLFRVTPWRQTVYGLSL